MNMRTIAMPMNVEDLLLLPDNENYELVDGLLKERHMGTKASKANTMLLSYLGVYVDQNDLGDVYDAENGYQCFPEAKKNLRKPDISFVAKGRLPGGEHPDGYLKIAPDLVVETISPNDLFEEVEVKVIAYLDAGVKLIWIISPTAQTVMVRRPDGSCTQIREDGELSGEDLIPGFTFKTKKLFPSNKTS